MNIRHATLAALLASALVTAHAATSSSTYLLAEDLTDWSGSLDLSQFNPALGTLNSVTIELSATLSGSGGVENKQGLQPGTFVVQLDGNLKLDAPTADASLSFSRSLVNQTVTLAKYDRTTDLAGSSGAHWVYLVQGSQSRSFTDALHLAAFTGTGTVNAALSADAVSLIGGPSSRYSNFDTTVSSRVTVSYDFSLAAGNAVHAVPEPGTWALMAAGLGMVLLLAARRRPHP
jgi:hypothetical protein